MSNIIILPRSFSTTLSQVFSNNIQSISAGSFTTILPNSISSDVGSNFNLATGLYTVPSSGLYQITATVRALDSQAAGIQFGVGVHTSNADGYWFLWHAIQATLNVERRTTYPYIRSDFFAAGQQLRLFTYASQGYEVGPTVLNIFRIA